MSPIVVVPEYPRDSIGLSSDTPPISTVLLSGPSLSDHQAGAQWCVLAAGSVDGVSTVERFFADLINLDRL